MVAWIFLDGKRQAADDCCVLISDPPKARLSELRPIRAFDRESAMESLRSRSRWYLPAARVLTRTQSAIATPSIRPPPSFHAEALESRTLLSAPIVPSFTSPTPIALVATLLPRSAAPAVTLNPTDHTVTAGKNFVSFSAAASGNPAPTVQWQISPIGRFFFTDIAGATSATYTFIPTATQNGSRFRAVFTNALGTATTAAATLTVQTAPVVTSNPLNAAAPAGHSITFTATASGNPMPTVQWQVSINGGSIFSNISGATSLTYSFTASSANNGNLYRAVFSNPAGSATSTFATFRLQTPPVITTQPTSQTVTAGSYHSFNAAASGSPTPTVQWQVSIDGGTTFANLAGATSTTYFFSDSGIHDDSRNGYKYRAIFTNAAGSATTAVATLTVQTRPIPTQDPKNLTVNAGQSASFQVSFTGTPKPTIQWQVSTDGDNYSNISGAHSEHSDFTATAAESRNTYRAIGTNPAGAATSHSALLTVRTPPVVTTQPMSQTVTAGTYHSFHAAASGFPTPTVQWQVSADGGSTFTNLTGATSTTLSFSETMHDDSKNGYKYRAIFKNAAGSATSAIATLTVRTSPYPTHNPTDFTVNAGQSASFRVSFTGTPKPAIQWQVSTNGGSTYSNISGAHSTDYTFTATAAQNGNRYRAIASNPAGTATSNSALLTVRSAPVVLTNPTNSTVAAGQSVSFFAAANGNPVATVQWQISTNGGSTFFNIFGATSTTYTFTTSSAMNGYKYRAVFTNSLGTTTTASARLTV